MQIIAGKHRGRKILAPRGMETRPTSSRLRETLFNICQHHIEGARFLDLFAGTGAMGLEALSRGVAQVTFIDKRKESINCLKSNIARFGMKNFAIVFQEDVFRTLNRLIGEGKQYDIIYVDPPYDAVLEIGEELIPFGDAVLRKIDESDLLAADGMLFIERALGYKSIPCTLQTLVLKKSRKSGRSVLEHYENV